MGIFIKFKSINTFIYAYILLFLFLLSYTFVRAEIIHEGNQFNYYIKYYSIFILIIIFWIVVLFLNKKFKKIIIIFFSSAIFILYFFEIARFYSPLLNKFNFYKTFKISVGDEKIKKESKLEIIKRLKKQIGENVVPSVFPSAFIKYNYLSNDNLFPLAGVSNTTTVFCKEGPEYSIYKSDRYGFNNPDFVWNDNMVSWLLVGDSFVQGSCVDQDKNFASQFRLMTSQNSISLGMADNGPLLELATFKEYGISKKLDRVLWFYFERNDLEDLKNEKSNAILLKYLSDFFSQKLSEKQDQINKILDEFIIFAENKYKKNKSDVVNISKFLQFQKIIRLQIVRDKMALDRGLNFGIDPMFLQILNIVNNLVNKKGAELYFIYLPDKERYEPNSFKNEEYLNKARIIELVESLNIPIIDVDKGFFRKQSDPLNFFAYRIYGHYNDKGYNQVSKYIINQIYKIEKNGN